MRINFHARDASGYSIPDLVGWEAVWLRLVDEDDPMLLGVRGSGRFRTGVLTPHRVIVCKIQHKDPLYSVSQHTMKPSRLGLIYHCVYLGRY